MDNARRNRTAIIGFALLVALAFGSLISTADDAAESKEPSNSELVKERLSHLGYDYFLSEKGPYAVFDVATPGDRKQGMLFALGHLRFETGEYYLIESGAFVTQAEFPPKLMRELLDQSRKGQAYWVVEPLDEKRHAAVARLLLPTNATDAQVKAAIQQVANLADALESKQADNDEL